MDGIEQLGTLLCVGSTIAIIIFVAINLTKYNNGCRFQDSSGAIYEIISKMANGYYRIRDEKTQRYFVANKETINKWSQM